MNGIRIRVDSGRDIARVTLARPDVRNAFDDVLIEELTRELRELSSDIDLRVLILDAEGPLFCSGADFRWMCAQKNASREENMNDARHLYDMFETLHTFPHPTIARVQGGAYGGGAGLLCCCDFVVLADDAQIAFSEVRIGLVPATIAPFVTRRIGDRCARELFLTGDRIPAGRAVEIGLANRAVPSDRLDDAVQEIINSLFLGGREALSVTKRMLRQLPATPPAQLKNETSLIIAERRISDEGQEGMAAFSEKRKPKWVKH